METLPLCRWVVHHGQLCYLLSAGGVSSCVLQDAQKEAGDSVWSSLLVNLRPLYSYVSLVRSAVGRRPRRPRHASRGYPVGLPRACAGVYLSKDLMTIAGHSLKANITTLAPLVLPISEQLLFFINLVARKVRLPHPSLAAFGDCLSHQMGCEPVGQARAAAAAKLVACCTVHTGLMLLAAG